MSEISTCDPFSILIPYGIYNISLFLFSLTSTTTYAASFLASTTTPVSPPHLSTLNHHHIVFTISPAFIASFANRPTQLPLLAGVVVQAQSRGSTTCAALQNPSSYPSSSPELSVRSFRSAFARQRASCAHTLIPLSLPLIFSTLSRTRA